MLSLLAAVWTIDALLKLAAPSDPQIRPDAGSFAYLYRGSVYTQALSGGAVGQRVAAGSQPRWAPDSKRLAFLDKQVFVQDGPGAPARAVTQAPGKVTALAWSTDGQSIGYLAMDPSKTEDPIVAGRAPAYSRLYLQRLSGGEPKLVSKADRHVISFSLSPDLTRAVYAAQPTAASRDSFHVDLFEIDLRTGKETGLVVQPGRDADPSYSPDGRWIAFHSQVGSDNYFEAREVGVVPSGGGAIRYVSQGKPFDVFRGGIVRWVSPDEMAYTAGSRLTDILVMHSLSTGQAKAVLERISGAASYSADGRTAVYLKTSTERPVEIFAQDSRGERQLTHLQAEVAALPHVRSERVAWKSSDGLPVEGVLWLPFDYKAGQRVPLAVELHGGPTGVVLDAFPSPRTYPTQVLLQNGIAVFAPNFRGSVNFGAAFRLKNTLSQGMGDFQDVMTGIDHLIERGIADPDRLALVGWSYGGYLTVSSITQTNRFKAASIGAPATDWITYYGQSDGPREVLRTYFGGTPWEVPANYMRHSPRFRLKEIRTPSLLQVGAVDINHNAEIYQALLDHNVPVEYVVYPREGHGITEPEHVRDLIERNLRWILKWIGPQTSAAAR